MGINFGEKKSKNLRKTFAYNSISKMNKKKKKKKKKKKEKNPREGAWK